MVALRQRGPWRSLCPPKARWALRFNWIVSLTILRVMVHGLHLRFRIKVQALRFWRWVLVASLRCVDEEPRKSAFKLAQHGPCAVREKPTNFQSRRSPDGRSDLAGQISAICSKMPALAESDWPQRYEDTKKERPKRLSPGKKQPLEMDGWSYCCYRRGSFGVSGQYHHGQSHQ